MIAKVEIDLNEAQALGFLFGGIDVDDSRVEERRRVFKTNPESLQGLLAAIASKKIALPEFQRNWVWEPDDVQALLVSILQDYPAGSLMTYNYPGHSFQIRGFAGAPSPNRDTVEYLILDGQQRLTSLYQALYYGGGVQHKENDKRNVDQRKFYFFYLDLNVLQRGDFSEEAVFYVDETQIGRAHV